MAAEHRTLPRPAGHVPGGTRGLLSVVVPVVLAGTAGPLSAQGPAEGGPPQTEDAAVRRLWATVGLGRGTEGAAAVLAVNASSGPHVLSLRNANAFGITEGDSRVDVGILYARRIGWPSFYLQAGAGAAWVHHDEEHGAETDVPGLPLAVGVAWTPLDVLGLGVQAFGDVNATESFGGVTATVQVGLGF